MGEAATEDGAFLFETSPADSTTEAPESKKTAKEKRAGNKEQREEKKEDKTEKKLSTEEGKESTDKEAATEDGAFLFETSPADSTTEAPETKNTAKEKRAGNK